MARSDRYNTTFSITDVPLVSSGYGSKVYGTAVSIATGYKCQVWPVAVRNMQLVRTSYGMADDAQVCYATGGYAPAIKVGHICTDAGGITYTVRAASTVQGAGGLNVATFLVLEKKRTV